MVRKMCQSGLCSLSIAGLGWILGPIRCCTLLCHSAQQSGNYLLPVLVKFIFPLTLLSVSFSLFYSVLSSRNSKQTFFQFTYQAFSQNFWVDKMAILSEQVLSVLVRDTVIFAGTTYVAHIQLG